MDDYLKWQDIFMFMIKDMNVVILSLLGSSLEL